MPNSRAPGEWEFNCPNDANRNADWPINEILLQDLIMRNLSDVEITLLFGVSTAEVVALRDAYGQ